MILSLKELSSLFSNTKVSSNGKNLKVDCPKCGKNECYISIKKDNHPGRCWREKHCGYSFNIFSILKELGRLEEYQSEYSSYTEELNIELESSNNKIELQLEKEFELPIGFREIQYSDYLQSRGFTEIDYLEFKPGVTKISPDYKDSIIFPIFEYDRVVGFVTRSVFSKEECKRRNILRYQKSESNFENIIYGIENSSNVETTILVEGIFDYRNVKRTLEKYSLKFFVFPLLGVFLSKSQVNRLKSKGCKNLIFLLDPDIEIKLRKFSRELIYDFNCFVSFTENDDPGGSTYEEILLSLERIETLESFLINKLPKQELTNG